MVRQRYLELLRLTHATAASATRAKLRLAQNLRDRSVAPESPDAMRQLGAELRERADGCAALLDMADTFELAATLQRSPE